LAVAYLGVHDGNSLEDVVKGFAQNFTILLFWERSRDVQRYVIDAFGRSVDQLLIGISSLFVSDERPETDYLWPREGSDGLWNTLPNS
jgi:hypothetical protein